MLSLNDIAVMRQKRSSINHASYKMILEQCMAVMREAAPFVDSVDYQLPPLVPGRPLFDVEHAMRYLIDKLEFHGYRVRRKGDAVLHINWRHAKTQHHKVPPPASEERGIKQVAGGKRVPPPLPQVPQNDTDDLVKRLQLFNKQAKLKLKR